MAKSETKPEEKTKNNQSVIIAILATVVVFMGVFIALILTGVLKFGDSEPSSSNGQASNTSGQGTTEPGNTSSDTSTSTTAPQLIDNPNPRVKVNGKLIEVENLEFYLPAKFKAATNNGKNGKYDFNLTDDDGWATVTVYVEKSHKKPIDFLLSKSQYLEQTDANYKMNGQSWVQAENGSMLAYATAHGDQIYAIIYAVKLDSDATSEAMSMIPKTLYFKKIYK